MAFGSSGRSGLWVWLGLALIVIVLDQLTKTLIIGHFTLHESVQVTSYFNIVRAHNTGAAFSFLAGASGWQRWFFVALGIAASVFIIWMLRRHPEQTLEKVEETVSALAEAFSPSLNPASQLPINSEVGPSRRFDSTSSSSS